VKTLLSGYIDPRGRMAIPPSYLEAKPFQDGVARVSSPHDGRMGLIDRLGFQRLAPRFDYIESFAEGLARVNLGGWRQDGRATGGRWGLVAADGSVVVEPRYEAAFDCQEGRVTVREDGRYGFLDASGTELVAPRYAFATWHQEGLAVVALEDGDGYVDLQGELAMATRFQEATVFEGGVARVKVNERWGLIDCSGAWLAEPVFERMGQLKGGACWAVKDGRCCVLHAGGVLGDAWFDEIRQADESGAWPVRLGESWGLLRADGQLAGMGFQSVLALKGGLARAQQDGRWGFMDEQGRLVVPCRFLDAWAFEEERAAVQLDEGWTFIDPSGEPICQQRFPTGNRFVNDLAPVHVDGRLGFLDKQGALRIAASFDYADYFHEERAAVIKAQRPAAAFSSRLGVHVLPAGGLQHAVFEGMNPESHLIAIISFARDLDDREYEHLNQLVEAWERVLFTGGQKLYTENKWISGFNLYLRAQNLQDPRAEVSLLMEELFNAGFPVNEALFARWGHPPGERVMQPNADPAMPADYRVQFTDFQEYWDWIRSGAQPLPAPENHFYLRGALRGQDGKFSLEERHMPIWFPDVTLCMGALQEHGEQYLPVDEAAQRVQRIVEEAIARRFEAVWSKPGTQKQLPFPMLRDGSPGVEPVEFQGCRGYSFAFRCGDLLQWFSQDRIRFREPELMEALRQVVLDLDLEPVILWNRFQQQFPMMPLGQPTVLVVNLFERGLVRS